MIKESNDIKSFFLKINQMNKSLFRLAKTKIPNKNKLLTLKNENKTIIINPMDI